MQATECVEAAKSRGYIAERIPQHDGRATVKVYAPQTAEVNDWLDTLDIAKPHWDNVEGCWRIEFPIKWAK
jgi:hypothetical protein